MKTSTIALLVTMALAGSAQAQTVPAATPSPASNATMVASASDERADPNRVICRTEMEIGSLTKRKKTCMTQAQWKDQTARSALDIDKRQALRPVGGQ